MTIGKRARILAVVVVIAAVWIAVAMRPDPVDVESAAVSRGPLLVTIDAEGRTRLRNRYTIAAPAAGVVSRISLQVGDRVTAGATVARLTAVQLDPSSRAQAAAQLAGAVALREAADASAEQAAGEVAAARAAAERARSLHEAGGLSSRELDDAELRLAAAGRQHDLMRSRVSAAAADVERARAALAPDRSGPGASIAINAPAAGRVLRVYEPSERAVQPGTPLLDVGDAAGLEVVAEVLSTEAVRASPGQRMLVDGWGGRDTLSAIVRSVGPGGFTRVSALGVEEQRVEVVGDLMNPPPEIGDGYRVAAHIVVWEGPAELRVPVAALFRDEGEWAVFELVDDRARLRRVSIGERAADWAQVLGGVEEGAVVILYPSDKIEDGVPTRAIRR